MSCPANAQDVGSKSGVTVTLRTTERIITFQEWLTAQTLATNMLSAQDSMSRTASALIGDQEVCLHHPRLATLASASRVVQRQRQLTTTTTVEVAGMSAQIATL